MNARNKTASEVIGYLREQLLKTGIDKVINGGIYREGTRPRNREKEDVVLIHTAGLGGQKQTGVITIHLFVPNNHTDRRTQELEVALSESLSKLTKSAIRWEVSEIPQAYKIDGVQQHFIHAKLKYKLLNI